MISFYFISSFHMDNPIRNLSSSKKHAGILNLWDAGINKMDDLDRKVAVNPILLNLLNHAPCVTWILDVRTGEYNFISANTLEFFGYESACYIKIGQDFHNGTKHSDDWLVGQKLLRKIGSLLESVPICEKVNYMYSYDYRVVKPDGREVRILEQNSVFQQDSIGNITHLLGVCTDITQWKKGELQQASLTSELHKKHYLLSADMISSGKSKTILSKRELEIAKLMAEGRSSKFIADKLFISFHTVNTHRKNMIEKTHCKNTGGLVQFVIVNGLI